MELHKGLVSSRCTASAVSTALDTELKIALEQSRPRCRRSGLEPRTHASKKRRVPHQAPRGGSTTDASLAEARRRARAIKADITQDTRRRKTTTH